MRTIATLAAVLLAATPGLATAQVTTQMQAPNQNNPQAQANQRLQPSFAHQVKRGKGSGQARRMPTPTLSQPMTPVTPAPTSPTR